MYEIALNSHQCSSDSTVLVLDNTWCGRLAMAERINPETV